MSLRRAVKRIAQAASLAIVFPSALICGFGHAAWLYELFAHQYALVPGFIGNFLRAAFYRLTLRDCSIDVTVMFGSFFSRRDASVGQYVSIGASCIIGRARIGPRTQIASLVQIPSGRHAHARDSEGRLLGSVDNEVVIGPDCWVGSSAVVMANVGAGTTVGAGSVVVKDIPAGVVAAGNPARIIRAVGPERTEQPPREE
jgi:acetyltransferase-like isoleucine patch superfamily enzyme